jgi:hypothetical protein
VGLAYGVVTKKERKKERKREREKEKKKKKANPILVKMVPCTKINRF